MLILKIYFIERLKVHFSFPANWLFLDQIVQPVSILMQNMYFQAPTFNPINMGTEERTMML